MTAILSLGIEFLDNCHSENPTIGLSVDQFQIRNGKRVHECAIWSGLRSKRFLESHGLTVKDLHRVDITRDEMDRFLVDPVSILDSYICHREVGMLDHVERRHKKMMMKASINLLLNEDANVSQADLIQSIEAEGSIRLHLKRSTIFDTLLEMVE